MIVTRLSGGLGNQLFQYAAGRGLAARHGVELALDLSWFGRSFRQTTVRPYELERYPLQARLIDRGELPYIALYTHALLKRLPIPRGRFRLCRERRFGCDPRFLQLPDNAFLNGYWQCPRYFAHIADAIRNEATPRDPMSREDERTAGLMANCASVAVHVRRGDYVSLPAAAKAHGVLTPVYYRHAAERIAATVPSPEYFVFSDDADWARANLEFEAPVHHLTHNGAVHAFQDLRLMSLCKHQIIANSSLSWWGAWLNRNPLKVVIAPRRWLASTAAGDLLPVEWIRIENA